MGGVGSRGSPRIDRERLVTFLKENKLTRSEIAERLGCSRERVRQLELDLLGRTGSEAKRERRYKRISEMAGTMLQTFRKIEFVRIATRRGFKVEPVYQSNGLPKFSKCVVNGKLTLLRRIATKGPRRVIHLRRPRVDNDVCVFTTPFGLLIFPKDKLPKKETMIVVKPKIHHGPKGCRHDYMDHLNRWDVFRGQKR
jgi:hypothetical protein